MAERTITIEQDSVLLRIIAGPPSLWPLVGAGAAVMLILGMMGALAVSMAIRRLHRGGQDWTALFFVLVWGVLSAVTVYVMVQSFRRAKAIRGVVVDRGNIIVHTPDDVPAMHQFPLADLKAAMLQQRMAGVAGTNLVLLRRSGSTIIALRQMAPYRLLPAVDALNAMLQEDRHIGFEVVLKGEIKPLDSGEHSRTLADEVLE